MVDVGAPKNTVPVPEVPQQPPTTDLVGNLLNSLKTPEGIRLITNLIGAASGDPYVGAGIADASQQQYQLAKQQQSLADKEQKALEKLVKKQQDDEFKLIRDDENTIRKEYKSNPVVKQTKEINSAISRMDSVWNNYKTNKNTKSRNALDQALVISFNKMMDPGSVVRESEFARTPQGQSLIEKMRGYHGKIEKGGVGLTDVGREEIVTIAKQLRQGQLHEYDMIRSEYRDLSDRRGLNPLNVIGKDEEIKIPKGDLTKISKGDLTKISTEKLLEML
tara:strand:+ start:37 stop:867 length:831 start_codon:yes stop_codon:yes gene_type:complete